MSVSERSHEATRNGADPGVHALDERLQEELHPEFVVLRRIGDETFGRLYLAREKGLRREVVVKVLRDGAAQGVEARRRFQREARAVAQIAHPNVVPVFRVGMLAPDLPFLIEPYLGECTLKGRLRALGAFEPRRVRRVLGQLASGLAAVHREGIVHRAVRPEAVRCQESSERVLLTDFGLAGILETSGFDADTITAQGEVVGSVGYMSPEQVSGETVTDRTDVYALGVLGWRLLVGPRPRLPTAGERTADYWRGFGHTIQDADLADLLRRCLSQRPNDRPAAADVLRELREAREYAAAGHADPVSDLIERKIPHWLALYIVIVVAAVGVASDVGELGRRTLLLLMTAAVAGFLATLVVTWFHGRQGRQAMGRRERWLLAAIAVVWLIVSTIVWTTVAAP